MVDFATLILNLEKSFQSKDKLALLLSYLQASTDNENLSILTVLTKPLNSKRLNLQILKEWSIELSGIPEWLFEVSLEASGDLPETIASIINQPSEFKQFGSAEYLKEIQNFNKLNDAKLKEEINKLWLQFTSEQRFIFNRILIGNFKSPISKRLIYKAISAVTGIEAKVLELRLTNPWNIDTISWKQLIYTENKYELYSFSFPFILPIIENNPIEPEIESSFLEWNYQGLRIQLVKRNNECFLWSPKGELITHLFPEIINSAASFPDGFVLDGIIVPMKNGKIQPKSTLKSRLTRKNQSQKLIKEIPIQFIAFDILECNYQDIRTRGLEQRKSLLETLLLSNNSQFITIAESVLTTCPFIIKERASLSRDYSFNGVLLKASSSEYTHDVMPWIKILPDPFYINAVLIYASSNIIPSMFHFSEFTFALWEDEKLVPIAKTSLGFTNKQLEDLNSFAQHNTIEKFGPIHRLKPMHVFKIKFDNIIKSKRHKVGFQLVNPQSVEWLRQIAISESDSIQALKNLLKN